MFNYFIGSLLLLVSSAVAQEHCYEEALADISNHLGLTESVVKKLQKASVFVGTEGSGASGFILTPTASEKKSGVYTLVTNKHVLIGQKNIGIRIDVAGTPRVFIANPRPKIFSADIATLTLRLPQNVPALATVDVETDPTKKAVGTKVAILPPCDWAEYYRKPQDLFTPRPFGKIVRGSSFVIFGDSMVADVPIHPSLSGSPIFNGEGKVVAIASTTDIQPFDMGDGSVVNYVESSFVDVSALTSPNVEKIKAPGSEISLQDWNAAFTSNAQYDYFMSVLTLDTDLRLRHLNKTIDQHPDFYPAYAQLLQLYQSTLADAVTPHPYILKAALELKPADMAARYLLGINELNLQHTAKACERFAEVLKQEPEHSAAQAFNLKYCQ